MQNLTIGEINMARQRKSIDNQIEVLNEQISKVQGKLNILLEQREELLSKKREEEISELYDLIKDRGLSVQDVYNLFKDETDKEKQTA